MIINEIEGITNTEADPDIIYNNIKLYYKWIIAAQDELPLVLVNAHKESLWQEINTFQKIITNSNILTLNRIKNLETIKSKVWIR